MVTEKKGGKGKVKWGIRIGPAKVWDFRRETDYLYRTVVSYHQKGDCFVTNQALQDKIEEMGFRQARIGKIKMRVVRVPKIVYPIDFLPLGYRGESRWAGLGMAASIELQVIKDIIKRLGPKRTRLYKYLVGHHDPSFERTEMYRKMGLKINQAVPLAEYREILLKHIRKGVRKIRAERPLKKAAKKKKPPARKRK